MKKALLELSNGITFEGSMFGSHRASSGELVFTTAMVGYTETLTDPSYFGQFLVFSYPILGNYGVPRFLHSADLIQTKGMESSRIHCSGVIVANLSPVPSHWNSQVTFHEWLSSYKIPGVHGIDTRWLIQQTRDVSPLFVKVTPAIEDQIIDYEVSEVQKLFQKSFFDAGSLNVLPYVSTAKRVVLGRGKKRVAVLDCGVKWSIVRELVKRNCEVEVVPWDTQLTTVDCTAWVLSNGPGDPTQTGPIINNLRALLKEEKPVLGICLGHQLLSLASGAKTLRMNHGHRSHNQPVVDCETGRAYLTSQNHGYAVTPRSFSPEWNVWFVNANDQTIEGIKHRSLPFMSVQFHPEANAGPQDTSWIFDHFISIIEEKSSSLSYLKSQYPLISRT